MVVVLIAWAVLALLLGTLVGRAIHRADVVAFPARAELASWDPARPAAGAAAPALYRSGRDDVLVA